MDETARLKDIEDRAAISLYANDVQNALELYSEAVSICLKYGIEEDYKRVLSCKSMVATMLQKNDEALIDSISYFMLDQHTEQGYWLAAMSHIKHGKKNLALGYFLKGFKIALEPSLFLVEIVRCLVTLKSSKEKDAGTHIFAQHRDLNVTEISTDTLRRTLQKLFETESWKCLSLLVIGKHPGPKTDFDQLAYHCPASNIFVGKMLKKLSSRNKQKFGFQLAIAFLNNGASVKEIENVYETPAVHVGLRMFLETEKDILLAWLFKHYLDEQSMKDARDINGNTAVHALIKSSVEHTKLKQRVLKYLLENGCSPGLCDVDGKLPIDCITKDDPCFQILVSTASHIDQTSINNIVKDKRTNTELQEFFIQHAKELFAQSRFNDALESYIKAKEMLTSEENDVIIQCDIIECYLNMKDYKRALELCLSIIESSCGSGIEKVNVLRAYALKGLENWPGAFSAFVNAAIKFQDEAIFEKDIVVNIANTYTECLSVDDELDTLHVAGLCAKIKCCIVWELVQRADWNAAHRFFTHTDFTGSNSSEYKVMIISDLKPICTLAVLSEHRWLSGFITSLILNGMLEFRNITYKARKKKSYKGLHACVLISSVTGDTSLVDLVSKQAKECNKQNEQDSEGNTALHLAVYVYRELSEQAIAQTVVELLLKNGVNPLLKNHGKNTARSCIAKTNKELSKILLEYERKLINRISKEEEMKERKRKIEIWKLQNEKPQKIDNLKTDVFVKDDISPSENVNVFCKCDCKLTLQNIKKNGDISEEQQVRHLIEVIRKDHKSSTHHKIQQECVSLIADVVSKENAPEIMKTMLEISEPVYEAYLHELCHMNKWEALHNILKSFQEKLSNSSLQMLARSCSVEALIETVEKEETIVELLEALMKGGKIAVRDHYILVKDLLKRKMFRVLRVLFHLNFDPTLLSFYPGDTPIHAAVCIGLNFEHENCAILEDFVKMYNRDKINYECLNPCQLDDNGKSLDEIISNEPETSIKFKVIEILKMNGYQVEKMSTNEKIERLEEQLLEKISKLTPGILPKLHLRPIGNITLEKTNQKNKSERECQTYETASSFNEVDLKSFESLPWEIECTSEFKKAINSRHVPVHTRKRAFECIKKLAEGYREPHLCKALRHNGNQDIKLFEIKLDKAVRIIWEKAINFSPRCNDMSAVSDNECDVIYSEVIRIWNIVLNHDKIHACVENITKSYKNCEVFRLSCSPKQESGIKGSTELKLPKLFKKRCTNELMVFGETEHNFYISVNPNVAKFYDISPDLVSHALNYFNNDVDIPFKVTDLEYLFIKMKFDAPILLLGRSGTGKTTCCIYKLWAIFEEYWRDRETKSIASSNSNVTDSKELDEKRMDDLEYSEENQQQGLRQLFVTKNPILCLEAERNFIELRKSSSVEKSFSPLKRKTSYETLKDIDEKEYPLFLTFKQLIELLDVSIGPPFYLANDNLVNWSDKDITEDLAQFHNNDENFSDFSSEDDEFQSQGPSEKLKSKIKKKVKKDTQRKLLTYEIFERDIWMKINKKGTNCHASLVWTEIRSFIKGSFAALYSSKGHLNLEQYKEIGRKMAPLFQDDRDLIYEMFQLYENVKKNSHYVDEGDVTFNLFHRIRNLRKENCFHELYVDETQDFTNAELCILMQLCLIPNRIFLTGDTAQCIMQGISFRFKDLQSLFFEIKEKGRHMVSVPEKVYHLPHNYRSHAGILNLATSVLDILKNFFPDSFDELGDDKGMMTGPNPVILQKSRIEDLNLLLSRNERETSKIDLGAHQVVLVSKEETKKIVKSSFQKCLVLTIDCAKGLEFDDVLLFNFFKDSHATKEWRVVTSFLNILTNEHNLHKPKNRKGFTEFNHTDILTNLSPRPLEFDPRKHKILNNELKRLYTALTRARTNVWIFDEDEECRFPMFDYFIKRNLVEVKDVESLKTFSKPSANDVWCKQGDNYFRKKRYDLAADYFRNGSDRNKARLAQAYHERQQARSVDGKLRKYCLMKAAYQFFQCQKTKKAEMCLKSASQYKCLGHFYEKTQQMQDAASMYEKAILPLNQSRCLEELGNFGKAISVLVDCSDFDNARECLKRFLSHKRSKDEIPESLDSDSKICLKAADYFGKIQNSSMFLEYIKNIKCGKTKFAMLLKYNFIDEAFRLNTPRGTKDEQVEFYIQCGAVQKALDILKENCEERSKENKIKQFQCTLIMGQIAIETKEEKNVSEIEKKLNEIIHDCSDLVTLAKANLLIGQFLHTQEYIEHAFDLFDWHSGMFVQIECVDRMITKRNLSKDVELRKIIRYLEKMFIPGTKMKCFLKSDSVFEQETFQKMCALYDFYNYNKNEYKLYPRQCPLGLKMIKEKQECQQFEICFDKTALEEHCKEYLKRRFKVWKKQLIDAFAEKRKQFLRLNNVDMVTQFNIISIKAAICLNRVVFCSIRSQCEIFLSDLYCIIFPDTFVTCSNQCEDVSAFLQSDDFSFIKKSIKGNLIPALQRIGSRNERGIAKFIRFFLMANLLDCMDLVFSAEQISDKSDIDLSVSFQTFFNLLVQMEVEKAVCEFDNFCYLISKENIIPFPYDLFMLLCEMFLTSAFYIVARSHDETCWFVVPQNYSDSLKTVENVFLRKNSVMKKISHNNKSKPELAFCLTHLMHILCGLSCKLNLLNNRSNKQTEDRMLVLGFTILCNFGGILSTADCIKIESNLARGLYQNLKRNRRETIKKAMSEANFLIDFHKPLHELLKSGEHKILWCRWDSEQGLTYATEKDVHHFKRIPIQDDTRIAITEVEISSKENKVFCVSRQNKEMSNLKFPLLDFAKKTIRSSKKSSRGKGGREQNASHKPEQSVNNAFLQNDETTKQRTEDCINDSNEATSTELFIEDTKDELKISNDNGGATNSYVENVAFDNGAEQNKLFDSGQPSEILDRSLFENKNITDRNDDDFHDAKRLPDFDDNVEATSTVSIAGNMAFEKNSNQKELHDGDQIEENRKMNNLFGHKNLTNDNNDGFPDDNLLADSVSIMASQDSNIEDLKREFTDEKSSQATTCKFHCTNNLLTKSTEAEKTNQHMNNVDLNDRKFDKSYFQNDDKIEDNHCKKNSNINPETVLPETNKSMHANDTGDCDQHTQWEDDHDAPLNDIRHLFEVQNVDFMDDQDAPLAFIKYLFEDLTNEDTYSTS